MSGGHLSDAEIRRRMALLGPVHEAINTAALAIADAAEFDQFLKDLRNLARFYSDDTPPTD